MLNKSGYNPHPCVVPLLVLTGSEVCPSLYFMHTFEFLCRLGTDFEVVLVCLPSLKYNITFPVKVSYASSQPLEKINVGKLINTKLN
jgi:hypothetical protein